MNTPLSRCSTSKLLSIPVHPWIAIALFFLINGNALADDTALFQGTWEMIGQNGGNPIRVVKTIEGNRETVQVYSKGILTQEHQVEFELKTYGPAKVFRWKAGQITAGPRTGNQLPAGRFIYKIDKKTLTGIHGMLEGDRTPVIREVYKRVGDAPIQPST